MIKYIDRFQRMDALIHLRATGSPTEFAEKLGIKRSTMFMALQEMKSMGAEIKYSNTIHSYFYADGKRFRFSRNPVEDI